MRKAFVQPLLLVILILLSDQLLKIWVKTNMYLGEEIRVIGNWFILHFIENEGMAFGLKFGGEKGKLFLSIFRIVAVIAIGYAWYYIIREKYHPGLIISISLILAGAIGNVIDSAFYGLIFSDSHQAGQIARLFPHQGGYGSFLQGRVVDMFYFPIIKTHLPAWFPFWSGREFIFFRPVFNIADASITVGVFILLIFQKRFFPPKAEKKKDAHL